MLFRAVFAKPQTPDDELREFVIRFFRATDEVEIQERHVRNSGMVGGRFLTKGRYTKSLLGGGTAPLTASDFAAGATVNIAGRTFLLTELDERSRRMLEGDSIGVPSSDLRVQQLVVALKDHLNAKFVRAHEAFRSLSSQTGVVTTEDIQRFFAHASGAITSDEAAAVADYFAPGGLGVVNFDSFCRIMGYNEATVDSASNNIQSVRDARALDLSNPRDREHCVAVSQRVDTVKSEAAKRLLRSNLVSKMMQRRGTAQEVFRVLCSQGVTHAAVLTRDAFEKALETVLHLQLPQHEKDLVAEMLFPSPASAAAGIDFKVFSSFVHAA
jgi:hypothetical protein